jgi:Uri superfamily endonuclease
VLVPGLYLYVGSARRGIEVRSARHERLATSKKGKRRWHIDSLLIHPDSVLTRIEAFPGVGECDLSRRIADLCGITVPIRRFGASDCRSGCPAHLYRSDKMRLSIAGGQGLP